MRVRDHGYASHSSWRGKKLIIQPNRTNLTTIQDLIFTSGKEDGKIKVWSSETGRLLRSFLGHQKGVNHMSTNADQTKMYTAGVSSSDGGEIREWDLTIPNVRVPVWTAFLADVSDVTSVLAEKGEELRTRAHWISTSTLHISKTRRFAPPLATPLSLVADLIFSFGFIHDRKNSPLFAPHQLNPTLLKRNSPGWGADFTSSDITLRTMFEIGKGVKEEDRVRYNDKKHSAKDVHMYETGTWQRSHSQKITAMCYAPTSYCEGRIVTERSELNTSAKNYAADNPNASRYKFFFTSSLDGTCKVRGCFDSAYRYTPPYAILTRHRRLGPRNTNAALAPSRRE